MIIIALEFLLLTLAVSYSKFKLKYYSVIRTDIARVSFNFVEFTTRKYITKDITIPAAEVKLLTNPNNILQN